MGIRTSETASGCGAAALRQARRATPQRPCPATTRRPGQTDRTPGATVPAPPAIVPRYGWWRSPAGRFELGHAAGLRCGSVPWTGRLPSSLSARRPAARIALCRGVAGTLVGRLIAGASWPGSSKPCTCGMTRISDETPQRASFQNGPLQVPGPRELTLRDQEA
jgi:hypothetical protein